MKAGLIILLSCVFLAAAPQAFADQPVPAPAQMSDAALASYISGRLKEALGGGDRTVAQYCDESGCSVVVQ